MSTLTSTLETSSSLSSQNFKEEFTIAKKPTKKASIGLLMPLNFNHFKIKPKSAKTKPFFAIQYDVTIKKLFNERDDSKEIESKEIGKQFYKKFIQENPNYQGKIYYDFKRALYSQLDLPGSNLFTYNFTLKENKYEVTANRIKKLFYDWNSKLNPNIVQAIQLLLTQNYRSNEKYNVLNTRNVFDGTIKSLLGFNIDYWKGFFVSVRPCEAGLTINVDVANAVFSRESKVVDLACDYFKCNITELNEKFKNSKNKKDFFNVLKQFKVAAIHNNFVKNVKNIADVPDKHTLNYKNKIITVTEYFENVKEIQLLHKNLPCLDLGNENYTPIELCKTVVKEHKSLDKKAKNDLIKLTAVQCSQRKQDIEKLVKVNNINNDELLTNQGLNYETKMLDGHGLFLKAPIIEFKNNRFIEIEKTIDKGRWSLNDVQFFKPSQVNNWIVINFCGINKKIFTEKFINNLITRGKSHGMSFAKPLDVIHLNQNDEKNAYNIYKEQIIKRKLKLDLILVIFSVKTNSAYADLKYIGDVEYGIPTQTLMLDNQDETKLLRSTSNICLKINSKLGGINSIVSFTPDSLYSNNLKHIFNDNLMVFGLDVNHPSFETNGKESVAAVVGSIDQTCSYYAARMVAQKREKRSALEIIHNLNEPVYQLLLENKKNNPDIKFPQRLVFFRDGVSEGQFNQVLNHEMNEIRKACMRIDPTYKPRCTFIVVQKRHHSRMFPIRKEHKFGNGENVPPGTLLDTVITTPDKFDYFLCSHFGLKGTSRPCHYVVLHDENEFDRDNNPLLAYVLTCIFARSTTSVSYPAPTYYADICAERGRLLISRQSEESNNNYNDGIASRSIDVHENFNNKMFYI